MELVPGTGNCSRQGGPLEIRRRGNTVRVTATSADLAGKPAGWLRDWTTARESEGCLAAGEGLKLGERIVESMALDPAAAYRLMHADGRLTSYVDLGPEDRMQVDSPILREGAPADASVIETTQIGGGTGGNTLNVEIRGSANLIGFETAWFAIRPKESGAGFQVTPLYADSHIRGAVERRPEPRVNYFRFRSDAGFYRMFYRGDRTIILVSAATRVELDRETAALKEDVGACKAFPADTCVLVPQTVGMNALIAVVVNGQENSLAVGTTVRRAIAAAGERNPESVVARLKVRKMFEGKLAAVEFDPAGVDILNLALVGGEEISWR